MVFAISPTQNKPFEAFQSAASADGTPSSPTRLGGLRFHFELRIGNRQHPLICLVINVQRAVAVGARAGGLLAVVSLAADIPLMTLPPQGSEFISMSNPFFPQPVASRSRSNL
jgi:hypothetical protein